jgi:hypothetical protein
VGALAALLDELGNQRSPSRLVSSTQSDTRIAVKVLEEANQIPPVRVGLKFLEGAIDRATAAPIA